MSELSDSSVPKEMLSLIRKRSKSDLLKTFRKSRIEAENLNGWLECFPCLKTLTQLVLHNEAVTSLVCSCNRDVAFDWRRSQSEVQAKFRANFYLNVLLI